MSLKKKVAIFISVALVTGATGVGVKYVQAKAVEDQKQKEERIIERAERTLFYEEIEEQRILDKKKEQMIDRIEESNRKLEEERTKAEEERQRKIVEEKAIKEEEVRLKKELREKKVEVEKEQVEKVEAREKQTVKSKPKEDPKEVSTSTSEQEQDNSTYSLRDLQFHGVINWGGYKFTYYSQSVLPGGGLDIPGRHVNSNGFVADGDGYIVVANDRPKGTVIETPFGAPGKVYDRGTVGNHIDVYTK